MINLKTIETKFEKTQFNANDSSNFQSLALFSVYVIQLLFSNTAFSLINSNY
jgi:hypothetical protein